MRVLAIRVDANTVPALVFGGLLVIGAIVMAVFIWRSRRALEPIVQDDSEARTHADRQFRRRMQISAMLAAVGILIPVGDQMEDLFLAKPVLFIAWVGLVFVLVAWMVLMALGDWLSTVTYSAVARSRLRHERRAIEDEVRRYHSERNGHSFDTSEDSG